MDTDDRIDLLLRLNAGALESRLSSAILDTLTPAERKVLVTWAIERTKVAVDEEVRRYVSSTVAAWIADEVRKAATAQWGAACKTIAGVIAVRIRERTTDEAVSQAMANVVPNAMATTVRTVYRNIVNGRAATFGLDGG